MEIKLSEDLKAKILKNGNISTIEIVKFIVSAIKTVMSKKDLNNTALKDLSFNGQQVKSATMNIHKGILYLDF